MSFLAWHTLGGGHSLSVVLTHDSQFTRRPTIQTEPKAIFPRKFKIKYFDLDYIQNKFEDLFRIQSRSKYSIFKIEGKTHFQ